MRPIVILESPYAGDVAKNLAYARACLRDCLLRGEAPFASHLLYTLGGVLDDTNADERILGIEAGFEFRKHADKTVVYHDLGISDGMMLGVNAARAIGQEVGYRQLKGWKYVEVQR